MLTGYLMVARDYENENYLEKYLKKNLFPLFITFEFGTFYGMFFGILDL